MKKVPFLLNSENATNYLARNEAPCEMRDLNFFSLFVAFLVLFILLIFTVNLVRACANTAKPVGFCILLHWNLTDHLHYRSLLYIALKCFHCLKLTHLINMRIELLSLGQITMW